jgi:hypothetical protein
MTGTGNGNSLGMNGEVIVPVTDGRIVLPDVAIGLSETEA